MESTIHEGIAARKMEADGIIADRCEMNREVRERNSIRIQIRKLAKEITEIVLKKAGDLIEQIKRFTRGAKDTGVAGAIGDSPGETRGRAGEVANRKSAISGTARELESINNSLMMQIINYQTSVEKLQQQISELGSLKQ